MSTQPRAWAEALCQHIHPERATIEAQARLLTAHAVGWVTAAERLGLEIREEEPEATRARVLAHLEAVPPETWVAAALWGAP